MNEFELTVPDLYTSMTSGGYKGAVDADPQRAPAGFFHIHSVLRES